MPDPKPVGDPRPATVKFKFAVSEAFLAYVIDESGVVPSREWEVIYNLRDEIEAPELRRRLREAHTRYADLGMRPIFDGVPTDPEDLLKALESWLDRHERKRNDGFEDGLAAWIPEHGSDRLKMARERGYKVNRLYARERSKHELPGAWIDTSGEFRWRPRTDPTEAALALETRVAERLEAYGVDLEPRIVWVIEVSEKMAEKFYFEPQEAVMVPNYLGRYEAFLFVDGDLWLTDEHEDDDEMVA